MSAPVVGVVVADHRQVFAEGLGIVLDGHDDLAVLGVAHDIRQAVRMAADHRPAVLLLDADLPGGGVGRTPAAVRAASPATRVLLLLAAEARHRAVASGADGLVTRDVSSRQVVAAIHAAVAGQRVTVTGGQLPELGRNASLQQRQMATLSGREREVLGLLATGHSTRRIAGDWRVAESTVRTHVQNLLGKLGVHCKLEAAALAWEHGIVPDGAYSRNWSTTSVPWPSAVTPDAYTRPPDTTGLP
jgi:two-component system, NarL family, nitrate/nitrite response regulator NarL